MQTKVKRSEFEPNEERYRSKFQRIVIVRTNFGGWLGRILEDGGGERKWLWVDVIREKVVVGMGRKKLKEVTMEVYMIIRYN